MKKTSLFLLALCMGLFISTSAFAARGYNYNGQYNNGACCPDQCNIDPCKEYQCGPCVCYCKVTRYRPQYYTVKHCVDEPYSCYKKCTRYVPQYYTKTHCRYVPQYYTQTYCRKVPECYYVAETKCRKKTVCETKCRYVPYTYTKRICTNVNACEDNCCPSTNACEDNCCPSCPN